MAFLDNSGDIILDAVLTDTGRMRMAKGDGSFRIVKFALGDDEINYSRYNPNAASAYADLEILQTPIMEAFTNNVASMGTKLITIPRNNVFFLPIIKLNDVFSSNTKLNTEKKAFVVAVDEATEIEFAVSTAGTPIDGVLKGENPAGGGNYIRLDQGIDTTRISQRRILDAALVETSYMIEIDHRLGTIVSPSSTSTIAAPLSYIDDDLVATYSLSLSTDPEFVMSNADVTEIGGNQIIAGPRGTMLQFKILSSLELNTSTYLFDTLGITETMAGKTSASTSVRSVDTTVRITGATTGYRIDIPVKFIKKI